MSLTPAPIAIACNIVDLICKVIERIALTKDNEVEGVLLHTRLTSINNILNTFDDTPINQPTIYALEKMRDICEEILEYLKSIENKNKAVQMYKAGNWRRAFVQYDKQLSQLCNEIMIYQGLGIKMDTTENGKNIIEILNIVSKNNCANIYDNEEMKSILQEMNLKLQEIKDLKMNMSSVLEASKLVEADDLASTKFELIEKSKPFQISYLRDIAIKKDAKCGQGSFGEVFKGKWRGIQIAVKKLSDIAFIDPNQDEMSSYDLNTNKVVFSEIKAYQSLNTCPYIVRFYGITTIQECLGLVTEYIDNNSLSYWLYEDSNLSKDVMDSIAYGIAQGLQFLHQNSISHNDVKSFNIMLDHFFIPKLIDLGMVKFFNSSSKSMSTGNKRSVGTPQWRAPEYWVASLSNMRIRKKFPHSGDVFSFAVVLGEIYTKELPWQDCGGDEVKDGVINGNRPYDAEFDIPGPIYAIMQQCWTHDPSDRLEMDQVVTQLESIGVVAKTTLNRSIVNRNNSINNQPQLINIMDESPVKDSAVRLNSYSDGEDNYAQGIMHYKNKQFIKSMKSFKESADCNNASAMYYIGLQYQHGLGAIQSNDVCLEYFHKSANLQNTAAMTAIANIHLNNKEYEKAFEWLLKSSNLGDTSAMNNLGYLYQKGNGVDKDTNKAMEYYHRSAAMNNNHAMYNIGIIHLLNNNNEESLVWFLKAANSGNSSAMNKLGDYYINTNAIEDAKKWYKQSASLGHKDANNKLKQLVTGQSMANNDFTKGLQLYEQHNYQQAMQIFINCANKDNSEAMNYIADMYRMGTGVASNIMLSFEWYTRSANLNNADALCSLGYFYEKGIGVSSDYNRAFQLYSTSAEMGNAFAMYNLACAYKNGFMINQDLELALYWYEQSGALGNVEAMNKAGDIYLNGLGRAPDFKKAIQWFEQSANLSNATGICYLGCMHEKGFGFIKNHYKAFEMYQKSANLGNSDAMNNVAYGYKKGQGTTQSYKQAFLWYLKSGKLGNAVGMYNVGMAYRNGEGVVKNEQAAQEWFHKSAELKCEAALKAVKL